MATLTNTKIKDTYQSLIKTEDNLEITGEVELTDGIGTLTGVKISNDGSLKSTTLETSGQATANSLSVTDTSTLSGAVTIESEASMSSNKITNVLDPTEDQDAATKKYVDDKITAEDLDFSGNSGAGDVDLDSETFEIKGSNGIFTNAIDNVLIVSGSALEAAINSNTADISTNTGDISTNATGISDNATNIATNAADIILNEVAISGNTSNITTNANNIATNTSNISTNTGNIQTNTTDIASNTSDIATNTSGISTNVTNISTNTANISTNTSDISTNAGNIETNEEDISANSGDIATNQTNISTNTTDIGTNATNIATNSSGIATNVSGISTNATDISTNTTNISTNTSNISTNTTNITTNTGNIATNVTDIAQNASDIANKVSKSGDTMTGALTVNAKFTANDVDKHAPSVVYDSDAGQVLKNEDSETSNRLRVSIPYGG
jgi:hypothetical protein